jgi:gluconolactonase
MFAAPPEYRAQLVDSLPAIAAQVRPISAWSAERPQYASYGSFLEGPAFDREGRLLCVDILSGRVLRRTADRGFVVLVAYDGAPNGLAIHRDGRLFIADHLRGLVVADPSSGAWSILLDRAFGEPFKGLNDLAFAPNGDLYFTDQGQTGLQDPSGRLYRLAVDGRLEIVLDGIPSPNGLAFDRSGETLWLAATRANQIWRLPLRADGRATKVGVFVQLQGSGPDGLAVADDDSVWVAQPGIGSIWGFSRHGEPIARIRSASKGGMTTNLAFGWPDNGCLYFVESTTGTLQCAEVDRSGASLFAHQAAHPDERP